jgi:hypothetical protein
MAWQYENPKSDLTIETTPENASDLTRETWEEGTIRTDGESTQVWRCGAWVDVE